MRQCGPNTRQFVDENANDIYSNQQVEDVTPDTQFAHQTTFDRMLWNK